MHPVSGHTHARIIPPRDIEDVPRPPGRIITEPTLGPLRSVKNKRLSFYLEVLLIGPWASLVLTPIAVITGLQAVRAEVAPQYQKWFMVLSYLPDWQWRTWAIIALVVLCGAILEGAFRVHHKQRLQERPARDNEWPRLTDTDKASLSLALSHGKICTVRIYTQAPVDCVRLGEDLYRLFQTMRWDVKEPETLGTIRIRPGIQVLTVSGMTNHNPPQEIKQASGAAALVHALCDVGLPATYSDNLSGVVGDQTIELRIGVKPE